MSTTGEYIEAFRAPDQRTQVEHLNGIDWIDVPVPRWWHRCWAQTRGWTNYFEFVERCGCGAIRIPHISRRWMERNARRRGR